MSTKVIPTNDAEFDKQPDASESKTPGKKKKTRLRRFGDVVLTNEATIEVVLKYQCAFYMCIPFIQQPRL